jgi:tRNA (Thr-GGU) A37 N-methylase
VDILDGTPLLDIKPYIPAFEEQTDVRTGWLEGAVRAVAERKSDGRFAEDARDRGERGSE